MLFWVAELPTWLPGLGVGCQRGCRVASWVARLQALLPRCQLGCHVWLLFRCRVAGGSAWVLARLLGH